MLETGDPGGQVTQVAGPLGGRQDHRGGAVAHRRAVVRPQRVREVRLGEGVAVNPSGGALCGNPMFAAGLARIGLAARAVMSGRASRALGHATSGPVLQQNLVCVLSGEAS